MDFKYKIGDKVYRKANSSYSCVSEHVITSITFDKEGVCYGCDDLIILQESELHSDKQDCSKSLIDDLQKKLDALQSKE